MRAFPGSASAAREEIIEQSVRAGGVNVFPGWEFYAPVAGSAGTIFDLLPNAAVIADEPELLNSELEQFWGRVTEAHERSGVGNLVRPSDLYVSPEEWPNKLQSIPGVDLEHLGVTRGDDLETVEIHSQPSPRFHGSIPMMLEEVKKHWRQIAACWWPRRTPASWSGWRIFSPSTRFRSAWVAAPVAAKVMRMRLLTSQAKCSPQPW